MAALNFFDLESHGFCHCPLTVTPAASPEFDLIRLTIL
jgi:hypothetical protein